MVTLVRLAAFAALIGFAHLLGWILGVDGLRALVYVILWMVLDPGREARVAR
jgi:hypothetical protein